MIIACTRCHSEYTYEPDPARPESQVPCPACNAAIAIPRAKGTAARAAVVRKGAARERRDIVAEAAAKVRAEEAAERASMAPNSQRHGQRNETSVLFTLDALRASSRPPPPSEPVETLVPRDGESGIVDIGAMMAMGQEPVTARGAVEPLFFSAPPVVKDTQISIPDALLPAPNRGRMFGMIAATVVVLGIGSAALLTRGNSEDAAKAAAAAAPLAPPPPPAAPPPPVVETAPAPVAEAKPETKSEASSKKGRATGKTKGHASRSAGATKVAASAPAKRGGGDKCGCGGDLMCAIQCSAK
ncbi:MAG: hypothetical protein U0169_00275 [Polyangiaceae bacterium]